MAVPVFFGQQPAVFITAHKVTGGWNPGSTTWNNQPAYQSNVLDYCSVKQVQSGNTITVTPCGFNVTKLVREWYNTGVNHGIVITAQNETPYQVSRFSFLLIIHPITLMELLPSISRKESFITVVQQDSRTITATMSRMPDAQAMAMLMTSMETLYGCMKMRQPAVDCCRFISVMCIICQNGVKTTVWEKAGE